MDDFSCKIKMNDLICPICENKLYLKQPYHTAMFVLRDRKNFLNNPAGVQIYLRSAKCKCGNTYKIYFDCHCWDKHITMVKNRIVRT